MTQPFKKTEKQVEATQLHSADATHIMLYGGSRSGKTFITLRTIILRALKVKSRHAILRLRFDHVKRAVWYDTLPKVMQLCFPGLPYKENKSDWFIEFSNGSQIWFGGLDDKERVEKILGNEYSGIYLNECSQIDWGSVGIILTRLAELTTLTNRMYYDCNPPSVKHWTYKCFIEHVDPLTGEKQKKPDNYQSLLMNPMDNLENIATGYVDDILGGLSKRDRLRFELGQFLMDVEGALWTQDMIIAAQSKDEVEKKVTIVGVDPAVTNNEHSDLTGIVVCSGDGEYGSVDADYSMKASPNVWAKAAVNAYHKHQADAIVVEVNQGGDLVKELLKSVDKTVKIHMVRASKGKFARAEPVSALYEQKKIKHAEGLLELETELTEYVPMTSKKSPDRLDAMVWALTHLMVKQPRERRVLII